nr:lysophospholipid acyltransferase family protein [Sedimentibacter sp.]
MLYKIAVFILKILVFLVFDLRKHNSENFNNSDGKYIICANHISMLDPVMLAVSSRRNICFMGKKELFENRFLGYIFGKLGAFPVDRSGVSLSAIKNSLSVLNRNEVLGIFPEGTRVKEYDEENAKPGIAMIANKANSKIIPVYISGQYKFRGKIDVYFGKEKNYFENYTGKINTEKYTEVGKEILKDIYALGKDR